MSLHRMELKKKIQIILNDKDDNKLEEINCLMNLFSNLIERSENFATSRGQEISKLRKRIQVLEGKNENR